MLLRSLKYADGFYSISNFLIRNGRKINKEKIRAFEYATAQLNLFENTLHFAHCICIISFVYIQVTDVKIHLLIVDDRILYVHFA